MNWRKATLLGLGIIGALFIFVIYQPRVGVPKKLADTRESLGKAGFKLNLSQFDLSTSGALRTRADALITITENPASALGRNPIDYMARAGRDSVIVVWQQDRLPGPNGENLWPMVVQDLDASRYLLDAACRAATSGPIRFNIEVRDEPTPLLPHLTRLRSLMMKLSGRIMLDLHVGNKNDAWTDLLAATRLATSWDPKPVDICYLVRYSLITMAYNATWQALASEDWTDDQLAVLQREWESVNLFQDLPETAAFSRVSSTVSCQSERAHPLGRSMPFADLVRSPAAIPGYLSDTWRQFGYLRQGSYQDETTLLLYYRDREIDLQRAIQSPTWEAMRPLPEATNFVPIGPLISRRLQSMFTVGRLAGAWARMGPTLLTRTAEAEARRRLLITAIALHRFHRAHGAYPQTLAELSPQLLASALPDFMDGQPLRYRLTEDDRFALYSVGLNCIDDGGQMPRSRSQTGEDESPGPRGRPRTGDLLWPRPATSAEIKITQQAEMKARAIQAARAEDYEAWGRWAQTALRQTKVESILRSAADQRPMETLYNGRALNEILRNPGAMGTNLLTLTEMLTLRQVASADPETAIFELPIHYDALTNLGTVCLFIDPTPDSESEDGCFAGQVECLRATNGNCLLQWRTIFDAPGKHAIQAGVITEMTRRPGDIYTGPMIPFVITNLCQFSVGSARFNQELGATLNAKLVEPEGTYSIDFISTNGAHLKTISGQTANGILKEHWDLIDERGQRFTEEYFSTTFKLTFPRSGRTQTFNGP